MDLTHQKTDDLKSWTDQKLADEYIILESKQDSGRGSPVEEDELCEMHNEIACRREAPMVPSYQPTGAGGRGEGRRSERPQHGSTVIVVSHYEWLTAHRSDKETYQREVAEHGYVFADRSAATRHLSSER